MNTLFDCTYKTTRRDLAKLEIDKIKRKYQYS